jgi:hypothetical protein
MRPNLMHLLFHNGSHDDDSPKAWHDVPKATGDYDLDATILHRANKDLPNRLKLYVKRASYGKRTAYSGYRGTDD